MHHAASRAFLASGRKVAIAAYSIAEVYVTLTRRGGAAVYGWQPDEAQAALDRIAILTTVIGLTPTQTLDSVRLFADAGGIGARLYDHVIGRTAALHGIKAIVTWNVRHMRSLFPMLTIATPAEHVAKVV